jgi:cysteine-rich repeat protein
MARRDPADTIAMPSPMRACAVAAVLSLLALPGLGSAEPIQRARTFFDTDWVTVGAGGIGATGTATFDVAGTSDAVHTALFYWHGIDNTDEDATYDNATIVFAGTQVVGTSLGDATTNCWGDGSSRAYVADVTALVPGDGSYDVSGLASGENHNANGASLIVLYNDASQANDRDLVFFEGNDSNVPAGFPGEDEGWHGSLEGLNYRGGEVYAEIHVADGQDFPDWKPTFRSTAGTLTIDDTPLLWDGVTVPDMGNGRASNGGLWDIHRFELTPVFGAPGAHTIEIGGMSGGEEGSDCLGLVVAVLDLPHGTAPRCGDGLVFYEEACDDGNTADGDCCSSTCQFEGPETVCHSGDNLCEHATCDGAGTCDRMKTLSCRHPVAPEAAALEIRKPARAWKRRLDFTWETGTARVHELGDPRGDTRYELCLYRQSGVSAELLANYPLNEPGTCGAACWRRRGDRQRFRPLHSAVKRLVLESSHLPGHASIEATLAGERLKLPDLPLGRDIAVQVRTSDGMCFAASFPGPDVDTSRRYEARDLHPPRD